MGTTYCDVLGAHDACTVPLSACRDPPIRPTASWPSIMDTRSGLSMASLPSGPGTYTHICHLEMTTRLTPHELKMRSGAESPNLYQSLPVPFLHHSYELLVPETPSNHLSKTPTRCTAKSLCPRRRSGRSRAPVCVLDNVQ